VADALIFPWDRLTAQGRRVGRRPTVVPDNAVVPYPVAMTLGTRQYLWKRRCPQCRRVRVYLAQKTSCSTGCGHAMSAWRRPHQDRKLRAIQKLAVRARLAKMEARIADRVQGLTAVEAYRLGYDIGYATGHAGARKGCTRLRDKAGAA
jgi:hypothetical protein